MADGTAGGLGTGLVERIRWYRSAQRIQDLFLKAHKEATRQIMATPVPTIEQLIGKKPDRDRLIMLSARRREHHAVVKEYEQLARDAKVNLQAVDDQIAGLLDKYKLQRTKMVLPDGLTLSKWIGTNKYVDPKLLMALNVAPDIILEATVITEYTQIAVRGGEEEANAERHASKGQVRR